MTPHRHPVVIVAPLVAATVALLALSACSAASDPASTPAANAAAETTPPASEYEVMIEPDVAHVCGQASALQGILFRSEWEHGQGLIDDAQFAARLDALLDGWTYLPTGGSLNSEIKAVAKAAEAGGFGYDNLEFQRATEELNLACDAAGSVVAVSALPGQGG